MERFVENIETALSQVASAVNIGGTVSVSDLEKRIQTAISQLEEVQTNIDYLHKRHIPTIELQVMGTDELPTNESILFAWTKFCRQTHRNLEHVTVIKGRSSAELRANDGTKLAVYDYSSKTFK
ncbi:MAG: hypothetical protein IJ640_00640 [Prevotella sp.]|nr:hypothetical protein [Prevotella sp.]